MLENFRRSSIESSNSDSKVNLKSIWLLALLALIHLSASLSHFLLPVVSKYVANDIHYGLQACSPLKNEFSTVNNVSIAACAVATNNVSCSKIGESDEHLCEWAYTGRGLQYQLLVGPSFTAVFTTTSIFWGLAADKCHRLLLVSLSTFLYSVAMLLTAFATQYWHLVILRMLLASGISGLIPIGPGLIHDAFSKKSRAVAMSVFHWGIYFGGGLSNAVGKVVTDMNLFHQGWRGSFFVSGIPGLILGVLLLTTTGRDIDRKSNQLESPPTISSHENYRRKRKKTEKGDDVLEDDEDDSSWGINIADADEEELEFENSEAQVLIRSNEELSMKSSSREMRSLWQCLFQRAVLLLGVGACIRQSAGFTWGYNAPLYYQTYYPSFDASWWLTCITLFGGSIGVVAGGFISDKLVARFGLPARMLVLATSQIICFPFATAALWVNPPASFLCLLIAYFFGEMWYGVLFVILVELLPAEIRSLGMAVSLFVINNYGGNFPVVVAPLSKLSTYKIALTVLYPGSLFLSSVLFFAGYIFLKKQ